MDTAFSNMKAKLCSSFQSLLDQVKFLTFQRKGLAWLSVFSLRKQNRPLLSPSSSSRAPCVVWLRVLSTLEIDVWNDIHAQAMQKVALFWCWWYFDHTVKPFIFLDSIRPKCYGQFEKNGLAQLGHIFSWVEVTQKKRVRCVCKKEY